MHCLGRKVKITTTQRVSTWQPKVCAQLILFKMCRTESLFTAPHPHIKLLSAANLVNKAVPITYSAELKQTELVSLLMTYRTDQKRKILLQLKEKKASETISPG